MSFARRVPLPISALALGLAGLGNLLGSYSPAVRIACGVGAAVLVVLALFKIAADFSSVRAELSTPAALSVLPTLPMALMLIAVYLKPVAGSLALGLWVAALLVQLAVTGVFVVRHVVHFRLPHVLPSWFIVFVGFVVASVTSSAFGLVGIGRGLLYLGLLGYLAVLPVIIYRIARGPALPAPARPTIAIFAAPPSLCLVGYLAVAPTKNPAVVAMLLAVALASLGYVLFCLPRVLRGGFFPTFAALTFPFVITATAVKQSSAFFIEAQGVSFVPGPAIVGLELLATAAVVFVLVRYLVCIARGTAVRVATPATVASPSAAAPAPAAAD